MYTKRPRFSKVSFVLLTAILAGCKTSQTRAWIGKPETDLVKKFGLPEQKDESVERKLYQYQDCSKGAVFPMGGIRVAKMICERYVFEIKNGMVTDASYHKK